MATKKIAQTEKIDALYCRLSVDERANGDSISIANQKTILSQYAKEKGFTNPQFYIEMETSSVRQ